MSSRFNTPFFKALLAMKKIKQWQISNAINLDPSYLSKVCQGKITPTLPLIEKIATVLEVKPEELMLTVPSPGQPGPKASLKTQKRRK